MTLPDRREAGKRHLAATEEARRFLADFAPDVVVMFAPDHMNLLNRIRPPFTGVLSGRTLEEFDIPEFELTVSPAARTLYAELVTRDVDLAVGEDVTIDHGMGLSLLDLFEEPAAVPLVPIIVNAIGFPLFPMSRSAAVGQRIGEVLAAEPGRIAFVGTGGLSHNPPFPAPEPGVQRLGPDERAEAIRTAPRYIDPEWDRALLTGMERGDRQALGSLQQEDLDRRGGGANEIRTWAAAWAAAGCPPASFTSYEPVEPWITGMGVAFGTTTG
ncbi:hypothetical protein I4I78_03200 [Pseudonocardia sp. KRD-291]|nr:hypothetical protein [Pseudonocardia sp. KRD291]